MAQRIPRTPLPQVEDRPLPGVRVPQTDASAGYRAVGGALTGAADRYRQHKERADKSRARSAFNSYLDEVEDLVYSGEQALLKREGSDALQVTDEASAGLDEISGRLQAELSPDQRRLFDEWRSRTDRQVARALSNHETRAADLLDEQAFKGSVARIQHFIDLHSNDPAAVDEGITEILKLYAERAEDQNIPLENLVAHALPWISEQRGKVVKTLIGAKDREGARAYIESHRDQLTEELVNNANEALRTLDVAAWADDQADEIMAGTGLHDEAKALARVNELTKGEPEKRRALTERVKTRFADRRRFEDQRDERVFEGLALRLEQNGGVLEDVNALEYESLPKQHRDALRASAIKIRSGEEFVMDDRGWDVYLGTLSMPTAELAALDPKLDVEPYLDRAHYERFLSRWSSARDALRSGATGKAVVGWDDRVAGELIKLEIVPAKKTRTKWTRTVKENAEDFELGAARAYERARAAKGGELSDTEMDALMADYKRRYVQVSGRWWGSEPVHVTQVDKDKVARIKVPEADQAQITSFLEGQGVTAVDEITLKRAHLFYQARDFEGLQHLIRELRAGDE